MATSTPTSLPAVPGVSSPAPRRGHRRSLSTSALPDKPDASLPSLDSLGLPQRPTAQRFTINARPLRPTSLLVSMPSVQEETTDADGKEAETRAPLVGLGLGLPQSAGSFAAARGTNVRNRLTIQAALGSLRQRQTSAPGSLSPTMPLSPPLTAGAPTFVPRTGVPISTPSPTALHFSMYTRPPRITSGGAARSPTLSRVPSIEQIAAWKRSRDQAAAALEDEWPATVSPRSAYSGTPELDTAPSSPDEPKVPTTPVIVTADPERRETGRKLVATLTRRCSSTALVV